jgi:hypothetical protein
MLDGSLANIKYCTQIFCIVWPVESLLGQKFVLENIVDIKVRRLNEIFFYLKKKLRMVK